MLVVKLHGDSIGLFEMLRMSWEVNVNVSGGLVVKDLCKYLLAFVEFKVCNNLLGATKAPS